MLRIFAISFEKNLSKKFPATAYAVRGIGLAFRIASQCGGKRPFDTAAREL